MKPQDSAFPTHGTMGEVVEYGLNARQYFAAHALQGVLAAGKRPDDASLDSWFRWVDSNASAAVAHADALIRALGGKS